MNIIKKIFISTIMILSGSVISGYHKSEYEEIKEELVLIESFKKELLTVDVQTQSLAFYLEKILKNEHASLDAYCIPKDEVIAIGHVLQSRLSFDEKQRKIRSIQLKAVFERDKLIAVEYLQVGVGLAAFLIYCYMCLESTLESAGKNKKMSEKVKLSKNVNFFNVYAC